MDVKRRFNLILSGESFGPLARRVLGEILEGGRVEILPSDYGALYRLALLVDAYDRKPTGLLGDEIRKLARQFKCSWRRLLMQRGRSYESGNE